LSAVLAADHLWAVAAIAVAVAGLVGAARLRPGAWITPVARTLAVVLVVDEVSWWLFIALTWQPGSQIAYALPLQICDIGTFLGALALWSRRPILVELTYFWGVAGTFQALVTPDLPQHFPHYLYFQYYIAHGGIVAAALLLVVGLRLHPRPDAVLRVAGLTLGYAAVMGLIDAATGANYLYLRSKPGSATLFDMMGPWPWYIASATLVGIVLFLLLDAPFRRLRGLRNRGAENPR
jgi:hypothetical integral membrane protein (TIGR02206 family)